MVRPFFTAIGLSIVLFGLECFAVDTFHWNREGLLGEPAIVMAEGSDHFEVKKWHPWGITSFGIIVTVWSFTLKKASPKK